MLSPLHPGYRYMYSSLNGSCSCLLYRQECFTGKYTTPKIVTLHGKTGKKVMTRARMRWHGTLSVLFDTHMCIFNKQNNKCHGSFCLPRLNTQNFCSSKRIQCHAHRAI